MSSINSYIILQSALSCFVNLNVIFWYGIPPPNNCFDDFSNDINDYPFNNIYASFGLQYKFCKLYSDV